jgi:class 3 adenylate cyclase/tetratricopeptide (TPR) repeat protein
MTARDTPTPETCECVGFADFVVDVAGHTLTGGDGRDVPLTRAEYALLLAFLRAPGRVLSRDHLLDAVAGRRSTPFDRGIDVLVSRLRRKIEFDAATPCLIVTLPGVGYKFAAKVHRADPRVAPAAEPAVIPGRRFVTVLASEVVGADDTRLPRDPEDLRALIDAFRSYVASVIAKHGGVVAERHQLCAVAYFGYATAQEHAGERAIHAALALVEDVTTYEPSLPAGFVVRASVASGLVLADSAGEITGDAPAEAVRMLTLADPGQVVIAARTHQLVGSQFTYRELGPLALAGVAGPVRAWQVLDRAEVGSRSEALYADARTPLVGREEERALLRRLWKQAKSGEGHLALLSGEAGIGKSRLLAELEDELASEPYASLRYFCSPLHRDSALHPIIARWEQEAGFARGDSPEQRLRKLESIPAISGLSDEDVALIAAILSVPTGARYPQLDLGPARRKERIFGALFRSLVNRTRNQPALMLFEDAQWADPSSIELIDTLVDRLPELPILLVISFRPEFTAPWIGRAGTSLIALSRLDRKLSAMLAEHIVAHRVLACALLDQIVARTDGVPLFIEELTKAVLETSTGPQETTLSPAIPDTLHASLIARLDRLSEAKQVAQAGAAIGREFPYALLRLVAGIPSPGLTRGLGELVASGLLFQRGVQPNASYTFKHALVQEAAYESLPKLRRAEIHAAIVSAAEDDASLEMEPGVLGYHCAEAGLIAKAAYYYRIAAERSIERAAGIETRVQLERGLQFVRTLPDGPDRHQLEADLLLSLGDVLQLTKSYADPEADKVFERAISVSRRLDNKRALARGLGARSVSLIVSGEIHRAQAAAEELLVLADAHRELSLSVMAQTMMGGVLLFLGRFATAQAHLQTSIALHAREQEHSGRHWLVFTAPCCLALTLACLGFPEQVARQINLIIDRANRGGAYPLVLTLAFAGRALLVLRDHFSLREQVTRQITHCEEHGYPQYLAQARCMLGWLEAHAGKEAQGLDMLQVGLAELRDLGIAGHLGLFRGLEADALAYNGKRREALAALEEALELSQRTGVCWFAAELHRRRGELMMLTNGTEGDLGQAEQELQKAVEIARDQSARLFELRASVSLARLWASQDKRLEACHLLSPIYSWFTEGFGTPDLREANALLDDLR